MLIISFDALGDSEFDDMAEYPAFRALSGQAAVFRGVSSIFVSNTYPVHASVVTGVPPGVHGLVSNTEPFPSPDPIWHYQEERIHAKTLWQAAAEIGIATAAVLWPATAYSRSIRYNIPEVKAHPGQNQIWTSIKAGSKFVQIKMFLRHQKLLEGVRQPALDRFSTACMADILREYKPGLALIHLTAYDSLCHENGKRSAAAYTAYEELDRNLAALLHAAGDGEDVILFSDHSQLGVHTVLDPNNALVAAGLLRRQGGAYLPGESGCYFACDGGSAFFHAGSIPASRVEEIRESIGRGEGFRRFLTVEELRGSGMGGAAFGFCAEAGYYYEAFGGKKKANHGYPLDMPGYTVFYMVRGCGLAPGGVFHGGSLLDIAPLAARRLGVDLGAPPDAGISQ